MKTTYLFNPENDMALACASAYYLPPQNVRQMAADMASLPYWYAESDNAVVLLHDKRQLDWMQSELLEELRNKIKVQGVMNIPCSCTDIFPWGWNPALCRMLTSSGVKVEIPDEVTMDKIRTLSGRKTAVDLLPCLRMAGTIGESQLLKSVEEVERIVAVKKRILLKAPWSGSGRGILPIEGQCTDAVKGWIKHVLKVQGYVVCEPFYERVADFAMEFKADMKSVDFVGYSMFETDAHGAYKGNLLASNESILHRITKYVPVQTIDKIQTKLLDCLIDYIVGVYKGYLGVDMMICRLDDGTFVVHPCVEINWRMNMGLVARFFYDRFIDSLSEGNYYTEYYPNAGEALNLHQERLSSLPLRMKNGKISSGYLSLTPVFEHTHYQAYVII